MKNKLLRIVAVMMLSILVMSSTASAGVSLSDSGLKIGAWLGQQATSGGINEWQQLAGRKLDTVMAYVDWGTSFNGISAIQPIYNNGSIAIITWEPWGMNNNDIIRGSKDSYIRQMATDMRNFGKEIYISLMHEANGNWYPWAVGDSKDNNNQTYIAAYRHVVDIFRNAGANNVKFIWCINAGSSGSGASFLGHYPGDNYVDYLAMDGYNWGPTQDWGSTWQSFDQIFSEPYKALSGINKPIIVTETSCTEIGGNKGQWITETFNTIKTKYPRVKLVSWFGENKEQDCVRYLLDNLP
ncbi:MAG: dockerin [Clostridium sp.]|nr:dockerin [Clostridium sp.]